MHADLRHIRLVRKWHGLTEQLAATDNPDFAAVKTVIRNGFLSCQIKRIIQTFNLTTRVRLS